MVFVYGLVGALLVAAACAAVPMSNEIEGVESTADVLKSLSGCAEQGGVTGILNCASLRTLRSLHQLYRQPSLEVLPGITLESDETSSPRMGKELREEELPSNPEMRADRLYEMLLDYSAKIISGRTLKVQLPENMAENVARALEESRKRKKGGMFPFMMRMGAKFMGLIPAAIAGLGLLATKALIVAKIALVLSLLVFLNGHNKRNHDSFLGGLGLGGGIGHGTGFGSYSPSTWTTNSIGGNSQYPYGRSIDVADSAASAQERAYEKQI